MVIKIKEIRKKKNISQYKLADLMGLNQSQISKIENNKRNLKADELRKIAQILEVPVQELFFNE
ncbi:helix-turn-helix domain-containing protein [Clostridium novyi]|nr:helix-turn-helix transcriptional regulator [Clostridium novyi]